MSSSPWPVEPVRRQLARKTLSVIGAEAWVVDDTGFVKDGSASPGVARQYSGTLGKIGNVQIGVTVHAVTDVPDSVRHRAKWELALEMIDELGAWGLVPPLICADAGYGEIGRFRTGLTERDIPYIVQVKSSTSLHAAAAGFEMPAPTGKPGRPFTTASYRSAPVQAKTYAQGLPADAFSQVSWRQGSKGTMTSRFAAARVRPANRNLPKNPDGSLPECWLLIEWPENADEPTDYWLSTLPVHTDISELIRLGKIRWRIEHDYRELKHGLGLDHFEGRTFAGWHHHVTLVTAAHLFITLQRLTADPKAPGAA